MEVSHLRTCEVNLQIIGINLLEHMKIDMKHEGYIFVI